MKISEANAVNDLVSLLAGQTPYSSTPHLTPDSDQVFHALAILLQGSRKTLGAGWDTLVAWEAIRPRLGLFAITIEDGEPDVSSPTAP